jgi:hypothetical protein
MMICWKKSTLAVVAALALMVASRDAVASPTNLVQNGDFSQTDNGIGQLGSVTNAADWTSSPPSGQSYSPFDFIINANADSSGFPSENSNPANTIGQNIFIWGPNTGYNSSLNSAFVDTPNGFGPPPNGDTQWLGMDGAFDPGPVSQTINGLQAGHQYTLSFYGAESQFANGYLNAPISGPTTQTLQVQLGSESYTPINDVTLASHAFSGWTQYTETFTATSSSEVLSFIASGTPASLPPFLQIAGVSLTDTTVVPVPEPSSMLLLGAGSLGAIGIGLRRRFKASKS